MEQIVRIQDIEAMRRREGIDDVELRQEIPALGVRDFVHVTLLTGDASFAGETVLVRITDVSGTSFRGFVVRRPTAKGLTDIKAGSPLTFTADHIHSLPRQRFASGS
ncbi:MAG TPA: hypothetical protein VL371_09175 [Gemmataceae bacterium]|jgi:hypothetical protein|nr:hypothetical protein [Gemmataceae bacterium]